jgi:hypothetical protein
VYEAELTDKSKFVKRSLTGYEDDGTPFKVVWKPIGFFQDSGFPLYPDGILELLEKNLGAA